MGEVYPPLAAPKATRGKGGGDTIVLFCNHPPLNPLPSREGKPPLLLPSRGRKYL
jgi:hypothetical protein